MKYQDINSLIKACQQRQQKAQMQLYDRYCNAMFNVACRYLKNKEDAKDAMQEGFLKAFLNITNYTPEATFGAWLKRIIINHCIDVAKKRSLPTEPLEPKSLSIAGDDDWHFDASLTKENIVAAIATLPEKYRLVITLYLIDGYDHEEISQILSIPIQTSRTHLHRAKLKLKHVLQKT